MRVRANAVPLAALVVWSAAAFAHAQSLPQSLSQSKIDAIETLVSTEMARRQIPGLSVAIAVGGEIRWANGFGVADVENYIPAKRSTVYRLGSVSKPITATAILQLVEKEKLDLDAPVQKYVPSFPVKPWPLTSRQLLAHFGGIRDYAPGEFSSTKHYRTIQEPLEIFSNDPLVHEPGTKYLYSTYGYNLLGAVVEGASGQSYLDYVRTQIFRPAGMERTRDDSVFAIIPHRAQGYQRTTSGDLENSALADTSNKIPGGGLCGTAEDVARFGSAILGGTLLQKETVNVMLTRQKTRGGKLIGTGLGWSVGDRAGRREAWHTGGQQRVSTVVYLQPQQRVVIAILTNLEGTRANLLDLARQMADLVAATAAPPGR